MITSDPQVQATQERIAYFYRILAQLRVTSRRDVFPSMASGYRAEIEQMQRELLDYLTRHASEPVTARQAELPATGSPSACSEQPA